MCMLILKADIVHSVASWIDDTFETDPGDALNGFFTKHDGVVLL